MLNKFASLKAMYYIIYLNIIHPEKQSNIVLEGTFWGTNYEAHYKKLWDSLYSYPLLFLLIFKLLDV